MIRIVKGIGYRGTYFTIAIYIFFYILFSEKLYARKTNQSVYEEPFDLAGGGASLTRASQEGVMFANPALMPYGGKFHRWFGSQFSVLTTRRSIDFARNLTKGGGDNNSSSDMVDTVFQYPIHFGALSSISWITNNFGLGVFARLEPDFEGREYKYSGVPSVNFSMEAYGGIVTSFATQTTDWFSIGITPKYLYVAEPDLEVQLTDSDRLSELSNNPEKAASYGKGVGADIGSLFFFQGDFFDYRIAIKVDDVGDTKFTGTQSPFKQTIHTGMGITFHGNVEALHLSIDYRDVQGVYEEKLFKRLYLGAKFLVRNHFGVATGLYQGIPAIGIRLDLFVMTVGLTAYGREMGDYINDKQRNIYIAYLGFGG